MSDTFPSQETPGKMLKADPVGKAADAILVAIAEGKRDRADALLARVPRELKAGVITMIGRYFPEYEPPKASCAKCGEQFVPARIDARYCSLECRQNRAKKAPKNATLTAV